VKEEKQVLVLAFYLPQFHPIPENDAWWGKGFTEWTNVTKARSLFHGHFQPNIPADLGYYDLRNPEARMAQAEIAGSHGITGFCYWHYWFGNGKRLLERPFEEVINSGRPEFPFCLAWANQSWTGVWHGLKDNILIEQKYPGTEDYTSHFNSLLKAFRDKRYIKIDGKPVFIVYSPQLLPDPLLFTGLWNELAVQHGFNGIYFIGIQDEKWDHERDGFNDRTIHQPSHYVKLYESWLPNRLAGIIDRRILKYRPVIFDYSGLTNSYDFSKFRDRDFIPTIIPNWDNTPRSGKKGWVFHHSSPGLFGRHFEEALKFVMAREPGKPKILFIKSWNEWAEGNYLEPDSRWGMEYLESIDQVLKKYKINSSY
jgi:hypothetical protein